MRTSAFLLGLLFVALAVSLAVADDRGVAVPAGTGTVTLEYCGTTVKHQGTGANVLYQTRDQSFTVTDGDGSFNLEPFLAGEVAPLAFAPGVRRSGPTTSSRATSSARSAASTTPSKAASRTCFRRRCTRRALEPQSGEGAAGEGGRASERE